MVMKESNESNYTANITRKTPALIVFMLDLSSSMSDELMYEGVRLSKAELLSRIMNITLNEIIQHCKKSDSYYDYFDIMTFGYSENNVVNLLKVGNSYKQYVTINELINIDAGVKTYESVRENINGTSYISQLSLKEYIKPCSSGKTPTGMALKVVTNEIKNYIKQHTEEDVFPPSVICITDGEFTDITKDEFLGLADNLRKIATNDGNLLFYNIHLASSTEMKSDVFPATLEELNTESKHATTLFEASSILPKRFSKEIAMLKGDNEVLNYRAFSYNSSINELLKILNIGSLSIKRN